MQELLIGKNDAGQRLDKFISKALPDIPFSLMYKAIRQKKIKVNRKRATPSQKLLEGDSVLLFLPHDLLNEKDEDGETLLYKNLKVELSLLYEDENILLINKPAGLPVHEDEGNTTKNLITLVKAYLYQNGEYDPEGEQSFAPALCNRIDRNTSGIVIAAKNAVALREMNEKIKVRKIDKFYLAAVHGIPKKSEDTLSGYLIKDEKTNTVKVYDAPGKDRLKILTKYKVIAKREDSSLLEVELLTGRTHQIRAHLAHIGHPLLGDGKYGVNRDDRAKGYKYQALCSYRLRFPKDENSVLLKYLEGKEFSIPKNEIYFTEMFFGDK